MNTAKRYPKNANAIRKRKKNPLPTARRTPILVDKWIMLYKLVQNCCFSFFSALGKIAARPVKTEFTLLLRWFLKSHREPQMSKGGGGGARGGRDRKFTSGAVNLDLTESA